MFSNIISYLNVRIPVQMYSALWILVATRTLKMIHTNACLPGSSGDNCDLGMF